MEIAVGWAKARTTVHCLSTEQPQRRAHAWARKSNENAWARRCDVLAERSACLVRAFAHPTRAVRASGDRPADRQKFFAPLLAHRRAVELLELVERLADRLA